MSLLRIATGKVISIKSGAYPLQLIGLDASKPTPGVGDSYFSTDTGKTYVCFINGQWSLTSSPASEEYQNHLGSVDNMMGFTTAGNGTITTTAATHRADHSTGTGAIGVSTFAGLRTINPTTENFIFNAKIQNITANTGGLAQGYIGLIQNLTTPNVGLQTVFSWATDLSPVKWYALNYDGGATASLLLTTPSNGDLLTIIGNKTKIFFLVNGTLVSTALTNIPNASLYPAVSLEATDANLTVAREIATDYISWKVLQ